MASFKDDFEKYGLLGFCPIIIALCGIVMGFCILFVALVILIVGEMPWYYRIAGFFVYFTIIYFLFFYKKQTNRTKFKFYTVKKQNSEHDYGSSIKEQNAEYAKSKKQPITEQDIENLKTFNWKSKEKQ